MKQYQIKCIKKISHDDPTEKITEIGYIEYPTLLGGPWPPLQHIPQEKAVDLIQNKQAEFYVDEGGKCAKVIVALSPNGHLYIKTENDGYLPNNLLSLPDCKH